jgi:outer membrane protein
MLLRTAAVACLFSLAARAEPKLGYVDLQRALWEVEDGKAARSRLESVAASSQKALDKEHQGLQKDKDQFEKEMSKLSPTARNERGTAIEKRLFEFNQKLEKTKAEIDAKQRGEIEAIFKRLEPIAAALAEREGMTMIFDKGRSGLVFAPASLDLTNELIRMYNDQFRDSKPVAAAPPGKSPAKKDAPKDAPKKEAKK